MYSAYILFTFEAFADFFGCIHTSDWQQSLSYTCFEYRSL